ncbi:DNA repair protein RadA [Haladaptatus litoreus]|uniref:DNA repair and recombination protein RadA n=1 Tax=Haladaptatus litoreus TaxID=553468 RepID=A0A1N7ELG8_9EURY|nr:DNA repair and recombination protein RadA [Haladaptatus litoreus]SIR88899.1 DNA repair protein RadA [Haladaptatus litoreus]
MTVELNQLPGVGPTTADKLLEAGFNSYEALAVASPGKLTNTADIGESNANEIIQAARKAANIGDFETGTTVRRQREQIGKLSLLIDTADTLLGGGIETQSITEFYGEFGSGKSQITHQLCVNVQLPKDNGGLHGRAIFIDTEDTFRPDRIDDMVRGLPDEVIQATMIDRGIDGDVDDAAALNELVDHVLNHIHVAKGFNSAHQILLSEKARELAGKYADTEWPVQVICVDSLTAHFRAEYIGRGKLAERQQKLNKHLHDLIQLANLHNTAIVVTNQVSSNPDSFFGDPTQPIGGHILGHSSTVRIYLRKSKGNKRIVRLVDAPNLPDGEAVIRIVEPGLKSE